MSPEHFQFLAALLRRECGLVLDTYKTYLAESRLAPVARQFGREDIDDLIANVMATGSRQAITSIIDAMVTNETYFFRDRHPFTHFAKETLPRLIEARRDTKRLQIWSAAASTGQEAYSLAMILSACAAELAGWRINLLGTDISHQAITRAKTGI
jgi:chemotaxis protein methyltransferase CheR